MRNKKLSLRLAFGLAVVFTLMTCGVSTLATAQETVLVNFNGTSNGGEARSNLILDAAGNLYGTTPYGGTNYDGIVFELSPQVGGGWSETVLYSFNESEGGEFPQNSLIFDNAGNLYGTTEYVGPHKGGTVFQLSPGPDGVWTETRLHDFGDVDGPDGSQPYCNLIFDAAGNLYGTTTAGGAHGLGTVFELILTSGVWTEKILHSFSGTTDGATPYAGLVFDSAGNLYGTTSGGGAYSGGTVFELKPQAGGLWKGNAIASFGKVNSHGWSAEGLDGGVIFDSAGNLYGATYSGGALGGGVIYKLSPTAGGGWKQTWLRGFGSGGKATTGANPYGGLIFDNAGNLYGTTLNGGNHGSVCGLGGCGTVFELSPSAEGQWTETVLETFDYTDGGYPFGGLTFDAAGNLYGTTSAGGSALFGTVFEIAHQEIAH
jgi:uncharacterized repeat protein (TIGR03803 family)